MNVQMNAYNNNYIYKKHYAYYLNKKITIYNYSKMMMMMKKKKECSKKYRIKF